MILILKLASIWVGLKTEPSSLLIEVIVIIKKNIQIWFDGIYKSSCINSNIIGRSLQLAVPLCKSASYKSSTIGWSLWPNSCQWPHAKRVTRIAAITLSNTPVILETTCLLIKLTQALTGKFTLSHVRIKSCFLCDVLEEVAGFGDE